MTRAKSVTPASPQVRRFADLAEAADYARFSPRTIRRMIARGDLTGYSYGRAVRVDLNEVDTLLRVIPTVGGDAA